MRLNTYVSSTGFCSRRAADRMISSGRVKVNGKVVELGYIVKDGDKVEVNGKVISAEDKVEKVYLALNKPEGIECTTDKRVKHNIVKFMNYDRRVFPIGRLDKDSKGLILMTNDGDIVNKILRAENDHEKEYVVTVDKPLNYRALRTMEKGVKIYNPVLDEEVMTLPCKTGKISDKTFKIIITQGMNRQIRRMCEALGFRVTELKRVRIMNILLGKLPEGEYRKLTKDEFKKLKASLEKSSTNKTKEDSLK
ncbi:MAG: pseudouridine synthase [Filifactoraceae bacterium]